MLGAIDVKHVIKAAETKQATFQNQLETLRQRASKENSLAQVVLDNYQGFIEGLEVFAANDFDKQLEVSLESINQKFAVEVQKAYQEFDQMMVDPQGMSRGEIETLLQGRLQNIENAKEVELEKTRRAMRDKVLGYERIRLDYLTSMKEIQQQTEDITSEFFGVDVDSRVSTLRSRDIENAINEAERKKQELLRRRNEALDATSGDDAAQAKITQSYEEQLRLIELSVDAQVRFYNSSTASYEYMQAALKTNIDLLRRQAEASNDFFGGFEAAAREAAADGFSVMARIGEDSFHKIADTLSGSLADAMVGIQVNWKTTLKNMLVSMAQSGIADFLKATIGAALGDVAASLRSPGSAGSKASNALSGASSLSNILGAGGSIGNLLSGNIGGFNTINQLGAEYLGTGLVGQGSVTGASLSSIGLSAGIGSIISSFAGLGTGNAFADTALSFAGSYGGSALASALGAGSFAGPAGIIGAVALSALGSLFKKKPSSKLQSGTFDLGLNDFVGRGGLTGKKFDQGNFDTVSTLGEIAGSVGKLFGAVGDLQIAVGNREGFEYAFTNNKGVFDKDSDIRKQFKSANDFVQSLVKDFATNAGKDLNQYVEIALKNIKFGTNEEELKRALSDLEFAFNFEKLGETEKELSVVEQALKNLDETFKGVKETAERLGLPLEKVADAFNKARAAISDKFVKGMKDDFLSLFNNGQLELNQLTADYIQNLKDASSLGVSTTLLDITYRERVRRIVAENNAEEKKREELLSNQAKEAERLFDQWEGIAKTLRDAANDLLIGDLSTLSPLEKLNEAERQFDALFADRTNPESAAKLDEAGRKLLELSKDYYASSVDYAQDFDKVRQALQQTEQYALSQVDLNRQLLSVANAQLEELKRGFESMADFFNSLSRSDQDEILKSFGITRDVYTGTGQNAAGRSLLDPSGTYNLTVGQVESIYRQALNYTGASGSGELNALAQAASKQVQDKINAAIKKAAGIPGFADGGVTPVNQPFLVGERGPEIMMSGRNYSVYPSIQAKDPELLAEFSAYRRQSAQETMFLKQELSSLGVSIDRLTRQLDRISASRGA